MKEILLSACGAVVLVNNIQIHLLIKVNRKPLNCICCMAGWLCLLLTFDKYYWREIPFMMAAAMLVSIAFNFLISYMCINTKWGK